MRRSGLAALAATTLALGACATVPRGAPGAELVGRSLNVQTANGQSYPITFREGGAATAVFNGRTLQGRWGVEDQRLCFTWGSAPRECWPYARPFRVGQTVAITSDRGNQLRVTAR